MKTKSEPSSTLLIAILTVIVSIIKVKGYSSGAPDQACGDLIPHHGVGGRGQSRIHVLTLNQTKIEAGDVVSVRLSVVPRRPEFKGFAIQVRQILDLTFMSNMI